MVAVLVGATPLADEDRWRLAQARLWVFASIMSSLPIGIFDSGVGGLTVLRALRRHLPHEDLVYLGDTARVPYGNKSPATVERYSREDAQFLLKHGVKLIVVACNTASALAAEALRRDFPEVPVLEMIGPGARAAATATQNGRIGIIATAATIGSGAYEASIRGVYAGSGAVGELFISGVACPLFVPLVEEGETETEITRLVVEKYLLPLKDAGIDTLVLGCTHYPLLKEVIAMVMGPAVTLVDGAEAAALEAVRQLQERRILHPDRDGGEEHFFVTDAAQRFHKIAERFLGHAPAHLELIEI